MDATDAHLSGVDRPVPASLGLADLHVLGGRLEVFELPAEEGQIFG